MKKVFSATCLFAFVFGSALSCAAKKDSQGTKDVPKNGGSQEPGAQGSPTTEVPANPSDVLPSQVNKSAWEHCADATEDKSSTKITPRDVLISSNAKSVSLSAKIENRMALGANPDLRNLDVQFVLANGLTKTAKTNTQGIAEAAIDLTSELPQQSCYTVTAKGVSLKGRIFALPADSKILVTDIDEVISALPEMRVPFVSIDKSPVVEGSAEVLNRLNQNHTILYLTARDQTLANKTRSWLRAKGFPIGPLHVWNWTTKNGFGGSRTAQGEFKQDYLTELKKSFPNLVAGIGNRAHDAKAYKASGVKPLIINSKDKASKYDADVKILSGWSEVEANVP